MNNTQRCEKFKQTDWTRLEIYRLIISLKIECFERRTTKIKILHNIYKMYAYTIFRICWYIEG